MPAASDTPARATRLTVTSLGSGSSGNATVVHGSAGCVLVDCGFPARETLRRMTLRNVPAEEIRAIVITHEHTDHVRGVRVLAKRRDGWGGC